MFSRHRGKHRVERRALSDLIRLGLKPKVPIRTTIVALLTLILGLVAPTVARAQTLSATPSQGPPGTSVTVSGSGFQANDALEIDWDDVTPTLAEATTDAAGSFTTTVTVPADAAAGTHQLQVRVVLTSSVLASTPFVVTPAPAPQQPSTGPNTGGNATNPVQNGLNQLQNGLNQFGADLSQLGGQTLQKPLQGLLSLGETLEGALEIAPSTARDVQRLAPCVSVGPDIPSVPGPVNTVIDCASEFTNGILPHGIPPGQP